MRSLKNKFRRLLVWLKRFKPEQVNDERYIYLISILLGLQTGLIVVIMKNVVFYIKDHLRSGLPFQLQTYIYFILPAIGITLTVLVIRFFGGGKLSRGISYILYSINRNASFIQTKHMFLQPLTSALTVAFGGSVGLEAPVALTGSAWGSYYGRFFKMDRRMTTLMLACGTSATIGAIFSSPIAGVIFALEVLLIDINIARMIPIILASVSANVVTRLLFHSEVLFQFHEIDKSGSGDLFFYVLLGAIAGMIGVGFMRLLFFTERKVKTIRRSALRILLGGLALGGLILLMPTLYGEGYQTLNSLISGTETETLKGTLFSQFSDKQWVVIGFLLGSMAFKAIAAAFTRGAGGNGGVFAPTMFVGGIAGFLFARILNLLVPSLEISEINFTLVGMAGVSSSVLHTPLTNIFLVAEITQGYGLFIPLMIVSIVALVVKKQFISHSFYTYEMAERGRYVLMDRDRIVLQELKISKLIEDNFVAVKENAKLKDLVEAISQSERNIFPVLDDQRALKGIILLNDVRKFIFRPELYDVKEISTLMHAPPEIVDYRDNMEEVMKKFDTSAAWNLPVVRNGKYQGFISKSRVFSIYREQLKAQAKSID
jgi:chloride channel protein, CIC family